MTNGPQHAHSFRHKVSSSLNVYRYLRGTEQVLTSAHKRLPNLLSYCSRYHFVLLEGSLTLLTFTSLYCEVGNGRRLLAERP